MLVRPYRQYEAVYQHDGPLLGMTGKSGDIQNLIFQR